MKYSDTLRNNQAKAIEKAQSIMDLAGKESREMTAEESTAFDASMAEHEAYMAKIATAIENENKLNAVKAAKPRLTQNAESVATNTAVSSGMRNQVADDPMGGFESKSDFMKSVVGAGMAVRGNGRVDSRLLEFASAAPSTYGNEASGADGGWAAPPQISKEIWSLSLTDDNLIQYCDTTPIDSNSMAFPSDEGTPWGTTGPRAYWAGEASVATATKPVLGDVTMRLEKLMALTPLTNELLADAGALTNYLTKRVGLSVAWKTSEAILNGTGVGQPLGALTSSVALTVSKDSGQATSTLSDTNLANMVARLPGGPSNGTLWLYNHDVYGALYTLKNSAGYPVMIPFLQPNPAMSTFRNIQQIMGIPAIKSQHANTFSSIGDVILLDLSYYRVITKAAGIESATSMHFYFDADATAFRTTFRMMGQPSIKNQIVPAKGSNKLSPFLQLQAR